MKAILELYEGKWIWDTEMYQSCDTTKFKASALACLMKLLSENEEIVIDREFYVHITPTGLISVMTEDAKSLCKTRSLIDFLNKYIESEDCNEN